MSNYVPLLSCSTFALPTPAHQPQAIRAAAEAVFATAELLENIIVNVPPAEIHSLKKVSKYWNQLIKTSPRIRIARCLKPSGAMITYGEYRIQGPHSRHLRHSQIRLHARLPFNKFGSEYSMVNKFGSAYSMSGRRSGFKTTYIPNFGPSRLSVIREEYITNPRVQAVYVDLYGTGCMTDGPFISCGLYVKVGIKIKDVLDVMEKPRLTYKRYTVQGKSRQGVEDRINVHFVSTGFDVVSYSSPRGQPFTRSR